MQTQVCPHCGKEIKASELFRELNKLTHICQMCGKEFVAHKSAKYCSNACKQRAKYARKKQKQTQGTQ